MPSGEGSLGMRLTASLAIFIPRPSHCPVFDRTASKQQVDSEKGWEWLWLIYYNSKNTWLKDKLVREYIDEDFSLTTTQEENMIDTVHTNIHNTTLATYRTHSNLWNVPERKVLIRSNSWNEWIFKKNWPF